MQHSIPDSRFRFSPLLLAALLTYIILILANRNILPLSWPDEALFSSPATELAEGRSFSSPVLAGLIPGMDKVTLWNCPLYMVLLSGVYRITGESQIAGRNFSLALGLLSLCSFYFLGRRFLTRTIAGVITLALALDPTFQRAGNSIRMDILAFLFFILAVYSWVLSAQLENQRQKTYATIAGGVCTGLAGLSHPFAIAIIPLLLIMLFPSVRRIIISSITLLITFSTWLIYIIPNFAIFRMQFMPQLQRKTSFAQLLFGGETGGIFRVYFSQYGQYPGSWPAALPALLLYLIAALLAIFIIAKFLQNKKQSSGTEIRIHLCFIAITALALLASEGWYVIYGDAFLLLSLGVAAQGLDKEKLRTLIPIFACLIMLILSAYFSLRHLSLGTRNEATRLEKAYAEAAANCESVYLRVRPDPYFQLRKRYTTLRVLEFIPGKLNSSLNQSDIEASYDGIRCFLLDDNPSWEPVLSAYLATHSSQFGVTRIESRYPLGHASLYQRKQK